MCTPRERLYPDIIEIPSPSHHDDLQQQRQARDFIRSFLYEGHKIPETPIAALELCRNLLLRGNPPDKGLYVSQYRVPPVDRSPHADRTTMIAAVIWGTGRMSSQHDYFHLDTRHPS